ncbi:MAG: hypothetical protein QOF56_4365, partial [Acidobacteriaceae bacterium]|nr:hypothetical protein [Acidobacteriaceae bacterium]
DRAVAGRFEGRKRYTIGDRNRCSESSVICGTSVRRLSRPYLAVQKSKPLPPKPLSEIVNPHVVTFPNTESTPARAESFIGNPLLQRSHPDEVRDRVRSHSKKVCQIFLDKEKYSHITETEMKSIMKNAVGQGVRVHPIVAQRQ